MTLHSNVYIERYNTLVNSGFIKEGGDWLFMREEGSIVFPSTSEAYEFYWNNIELGDSNGTEGEDS